MLSDSRILVLSALMFCHYRTELLQCNVREWEFCWSLKFNFIDFVCIYVETIDSKELCECRLLFKAFHRFLYSIVILQNISVFRSYSNNQFYGYTGVLCWFHVFIQFMIILCCGRLTLIYIFKMLFMMYIQMVLFSIEFIQFGFKFSVYDLMIGHFQCFDCYWFLYFWLRYLRII